MEGSNGSEGAPAAVGTAENPAAPQPERDHDDRAVPAAVVGIPVVVNGEVNASAKDCAAGSARNGKDVFGEQA
jgi:hypothetical protein